MRSGNLKHKVTIQNVVVTKNELGEPGQNYTTFCTVWAEIKPIKATEYMAAQGFVQKITHTVTIRYIANIEPSMRVLYGGRVFDIKGVLDPREEHKRIDLMCEEIQNG